MSQESLQVAWVQKVLSGGIGHMGHWSGGLTNHLCADISGISGLQITADILKAKGD